MLLYPGLMITTENCHVRNIDWKLVNFLAEDRIPEKEILFFATAEKTIKLLD